jgi:hypothetical protein
MGIRSAYLKQNLSIYRYAATDNANDLGEMDAPTSANATLIGTVKGMINSGANLEPTVRTTTKDYGQNLSEYWMVWFAIPVGFEIYEGDLIIDTDDAKRTYILHFLDRIPGGVVNHHYEGLLQTSKVLIGG